MLSVFHPTAHFPVAMRVGWDQAIASPFLGE